MNRTSIRLHRQSILWMIVFSIIMVCAVLCCFAFLDNDYVGTGILCVVLIWLITESLIVNWDKYLFNPLMIFSIMYSTAAFSVLYSLITDFRTSYYLLYSEEDKHFLALLNESLFLFIVGYICFFIGYKLFAQGIDRNAELHVKETDFQYKGSIVYGAIYICFFIALVNFIYIIYHMGGNYFYYMKNISVLKYIYQGTEISTIGYNFGYVAVYLYTIVCQQKKKYDIGFWIVFGTMIIVKASDGRIFQTIAFIGVVFGFVYSGAYWQNRAKKKNLNKRYFEIGVCLGGFAIAFYFFRAIGNIQYINKSASTHSLWAEMVANVFYYLFDKGNTANTVLVPKIIDSWKMDIGYLYGRSIFSSLNQILPFLTNVFPSTGGLIKKVWFSNVVSGALPPTCIGEFYANFGIIGIPIGMTIFGMICGALYKKHMGHSSILGKLIYFQILVDFIFIFPKTDFSNFPLFSILFTTVMYKAIISLSRRRI